MTDEAGDVRGYVAIKHDVSEREHLAMTRQQREARYHALLENMRDVVYVIDPQLRIVFVSPSVERVFGYRPEDQLGRSPFELIHPDDLPSISELLASGGHWFATEVRHLVKRVLKRLDNTARSLYAVADEGTCFVGTGLELALACDRVYLLDDPARPVEIGGFFLELGLTHVAALFVAADQLPAMTLGDLLGQEGEGPGRIVTMLDLKTIPADGATVETRGRPGLEPAHPEPHRTQCSGEADRWRLADPASGDLALPDMDEASEERAGREDDRTCVQLPARSGPNASDAPALED